MTFKADSSRCMMKMAIKALKGEKTVCTKGTHGQIAAIRMRIEVPMVITFQARLYLEEKFMFDFRNIFFKQKSCWGL